MAVWTIAVKCLKKVLGNFIILPLIIALPVFQLVVMNTVLNGMTSGNSASYSSFVEIVTLEKLKDLTNVQFFAASTLVQFLLVAGMISASILITERQDNTLMRIFAAPVTRTAVILGNFISMMLVTLICAVSFILISSQFMKIDWGNSIFELITVTLLVSFVASALGFAFSGFFKNMKLAAGGMSFIIILMTFLSDGYSFGGIFELTSKYTINKWGYEAYDRLMEGGGLQAAGMDMLVLGIIGLVLIMVSILLYSREGLYE